MDNRRSSGRRDRSKLRLLLQQGKTIFNSNLALIPFCGQLLIFHLHATRALSLSFSFDATSRVDCTLLEFESQLFSKT